VAQDSRDRQGGGEQPDITPGAASVEQESTEAGGDVSEPQRVLNEQKERYLRLAAEYDNFRKRTVRERQEDRSRAQGELVKQLIDSLDDLDRVIRADANALDAKTLHDAVAVVEKKLYKALGAAGLEVLNPVDQYFDPALHEAVATEPALSPEDDHVVSTVYQPGYVFNGQLLRPARVVVKQWAG